jgi:aerobic-type carbon monoxide dehydrogenase small subunit (CoxS/CutS family)
LINVRIDPVEKAMLEETFNQCGETLSGGIKRASYYVMQELKAGRLVMTKAGLFPGGR